jgi:hypothetical protein
MSQKAKTPSERTIPTARINGVAITMAITTFILAGFVAILLDFLKASDLWIAIQVILFSLVGIYLLLAYKIAEQWEKGVVLRFGRFRLLAGPGPFWVIPVVDRVANWIDHRVMVTPFSAEKTLTKDTT